MAIPDMLGRLPPYFNIDAEAEEAALPKAPGTADFAAMAAACAQGRADLLTRGLDESGTKSLRLFSTWEITKYLIPVAPAHFRRVLRQNPDLPQGVTETEGGAKWFTLDEVLRRGRALVIVVHAVEHHRGGLRVPETTQPIDPLALHAGVVGQNHVHQHVVCSHSLSRVESESRRSP